MSVNGVWVFFWDVCFDRYFVVYVVGFMIVDEFWSMGFINVCVGNGNGVLFFDLICVEIKFWFGWILYIVGCVYLDEFIKVLIDDGYEV